MTDLLAVTEDAQRILALEHLLHKIRNDMRHGQPDVSGEHLDLAESPSLADANAVEGPHDRIGQFVLFPCGAGEVFHRELLEAVRRKGRRDLPFVPSLDGQRSVLSYTIEELT